MREQNQKMQVEIGELKETMEKKMASNKIEVIYWDYNSVNVREAKFTLGNLPYAHISL